MEEIKFNSPNKLLYKKPKNIFTIL